MKLSDTQKTKINEMVSTLGDSTPFEDMHNEVLELCVDKNVVDLSEDEYGDIYEEFSNLVWDYMENI